MVRARLICPVCMARPNAVFAGSVVRTDVALPSAGNRPARFVDATDFLAWQRGSGKVGPGLTEFDGDFTGDQVVDGIDLALWTSFYPFPLIPVAEAVPEPASFMLLASSLALIGVRRIGEPSRN